MTMKPSDTPIYCMLFDGHGGNSVSKEAAEIFDQHFQDAINEQFKLDTLQKIRSTATFTSKELSEYKAFSSTHIGWMINQLMKIQALPSLKKSAKFFKAINANAELHNLVKQFKLQYENSFIRNQNDDKAAELFLDMVSELKKSWEEICKTPLQSKKTEMPDMLIFLYVNSGSCVFQHKLGCLLQSLSSICRHYDWKEMRKDRQEIAEWLLHFPEEPVLENAGCLSACFGTRC